MSEYYLAIDQGGHASRAIVFDQQGNLVTQAEQSIQTLTPQADRVEHDPEELLQATRQAIHQAAAQLGDEKSRLKAAGLATQRSSIACWNKLTGEPLAPILSWQDRRQAEWLQQIQPHSEQIHHKTGLFLSPHYGASKMRWCLDNLPEVKQALQKRELAIGPLASFLAWHMAQEHPLLADPANASRTLLWNLQQREWDNELLRLFGIPKQVLPHCVASRSDFGHLQIDSFSLPLTVITGDQSAVLFAWGRPDAETCYINIGTGAFIQRPLNAATDAGRLLSGIAYADDTQACYTLEGTVNGAARALQWYSEEYGISDIEQEVTQALDSPETPALFINSVAGLGSPDWISHLKPIFEGNDDTSAQLLGIVESIVFLIQRNLKAMQQFTTPSRQIVVSGGLSQQDGLCQRIADLSGCTVIRPFGHEATARGLACLLADQPDDWQKGKNEETTFKPLPNPGLEQRYGQWTTLLERLIAHKT
jgi:glycerol kinase